MRTRFINIGSFLRERAVLVTGLFFGVLLPFLFFGRAAEKVWRHGGFKHDTPFLGWLHKSSSPALDRLMLWVTQAGDPRLILLLTAALLFIAMRLKRRAEALFLLIAVTGTTAFNLLAKSFFRRARPALWISPAPEQDYGFPSGHAMLTMAFAAALILMMWPTPARWPVLVVAGLYVLAVGLSRLYLGVHFPSDVLAGWSASLAWVVGMRFILRPQRKGETT